MQSPAPGDEQRQAPPHAGGWTLECSSAEKELEIQGDHEPATQRHGKEGQQHPGLH